MRLVPARITISYHHDHGLVLALKSVKRKKVLCNLRRHGHKDSMHLAHWCRRISNKIVFCLKADHPRTCVSSYARILFLIVWPWRWLDDLDDELNLYILNYYPAHARNGVSRPRLWDVRARTGQTDTQTDATERITTAALIGGWWKRSCSDANYDTVCKSSENWPSSTTYRQNTRRLLRCRLNDERP